MTGQPSAWFGLLARRSRHSRHFTATARSDVARWVGIVSARSMYGRSPIDRSTAVWRGSGTTSDSRHSAKSGSAESRSPRQYLNSEGPPRQGRDRTIAPGWRARIS